MTDLSYDNCVLPAEYTIPEGTDELRFYRVTFATWPRLPKSIRRLHVDSCLVEAGGVMEFGDALDSLESLHIGFQTFLPTVFPPNLQRLVLRKVNFDSGFPRLPPDLETLRMIRVYAPPSSWPDRWPTGLKRLFMSSVGMEDFPPAWPPAMESLFIEEMFIASYPPVPNAVGDWQGGDVDFPDAPV
jgi:hypothetical protein